MPRRLRASWRSTLGVDGSGAARSSGSSAEPWNPAVMIDDGVSGDLVYPGLDAALVAEVGDPL